MSDLLKLADRIEAGEHLIAEIGNVLKLPKTHNTISGYGPFLTSLDATKAVFDELLPDADYEISAVKGKIVVSVRPSGTVEYWQGQAEKPATAWMAAMLRALDAKEEEV